jgi:hypothetical protein
VIKRQCAEDCREAVLHRSVGGILGRERTEAFEKDWENM